jgi:hypothetical protein
MTGLLKTLATFLRDRRSLKKRRLESILQANGMSRASAKHCCWQFFNPTKDEHEK